MSQIPDAYVLAKGQGRSPARYVGGEVRVLVGVDDSEGALSVIEVELGPGGPPMHVHTHRSELLFVAEGTLTVRFGDEMRRVAHGGAVWIPKGMPHAFANETDTPVRMIGVCTPGGLEKSLTAHADYIASLPSGRVPDSAVLAAIAAEHDGGVIVGPPISPTGADA
jgi:mannose-6-phosphate isomerase-like protein (cupin superfamily)